MKTIERMAFASHAKGRGFNPLTAHSISRRSRPRFRVVEHSPIVTPIRSASAGRVGVFLFKLLAAVRGGQ